MHIDIFAVRVFSKSCRWHAR